MLRGHYEQAERRALDGVFDPGLPVVECGASIGVLACLINRRLADPAAHAVIEANPALLPLLERHRAINGARFRIVHGAVAYGAPEVAFGVSHDSLASRLGGGGRQVRVPAVTLAGVADAQGFARFGLVCDIEGAEMAMLEHEAETLVTRAAWVLIESHRSSGGRDLAPDVIGWFASRGFRHVTTVDTVHAFLGPGSGHHPGTR
ncbi:MAG: FkbM family methyltransferase [Vicinamibacterales bacterium]